MINYARGMYEEIMTMRVGTGSPRAEEEQRRDSDLSCNLLKDASQVKPLRFGSRSPQQPQSPQHTTQAGI